MLKRILQYPVFWAAKFLLWLRYWVRLEGVDEVKHLTHKVLILPNHPGFVDPPLVLTRLWRRFHPRPMVWQGIYRNPLVGWLMWLMDSVKIPDMDVASRRARDRANSALQEVIDGLRAGKNHILWPSGRLMREGSENLGSARAVTDILKAVPDVHIVLVRTEGLWGSGFTYAHRGALPNLSSRILKGIGTLLGNLIFFTPRRRLRMTLKYLPPEEYPPELTREAINRKLESWYNANGIERPKHRSYHFLFGRDAYDFPGVEEAPDVNLFRIKTQTKVDVREILEHKLRRSLSDSEYAPDAKLEALGMDSLDRMELTLEIESRYRFTSVVAPTTVAECWALAQGMLDTVQARPPGKEWFKQGPRRPNEKPAFLADTIAEAFVRRAFESRKQVVDADDTSGSITYERMLLGALLMAKRFRRLDAPAVGLMLPATVAADLSFMALHMAGKLPVMLNWTTGRTNLEHAVSTMGLTHIVTSRRFVDRLHLHVEGVQFLFLEDLRREIGTIEKIGAVLSVRLLGGRVLAGVPRPSPDDPAVVLFTSGSEKAPKAVPLTHRNMLSNLRAAVEVLEPTRGDSLVGFLPAFHSFGLVVTTLLPILGGMRVVHHPDPTDAGNLVRKTVAYKASVLVATPTFLGNMLERAQSGDFDSVWLAVVGAEACPQWVFERFSQLNPNGQLLEGYGITECGPVVSVNPPGRARRGTVGTPLPGVEVRAVDPDSLAPVGTGERGMLLVHGSNVFPGYLAADEAPPFHEVDDKRFYITGDLAELDADGYIHFKGRLKRFVKHGGEMVSLPALEGVFAAEFAPDNEGPRVAVEGIETERGETRIVLFLRGVGLSVREANDRLMKHGYRGVMHVNDVRRVEQIPVLGTGKIDYKVLRDWIVNPPELVGAGAESQGESASSSAES